MAIVFNTEPCEIKKKKTINIFRVKPVYKKL